MEDTTKRLLQRIIKRIPAKHLRTTLVKWGRLTVAQLGSLDFTHTLTLTEQLIAICEENDWTLKQITDLEMTYIINHPNQGMWHALQLTDPEEEASLVELIQFKEQFKYHLGELLRHVSVKIKKHTDEAVWIRIAWGDSLSRPNNLRPSYVVHYLQTPYVFVTSITSKQKPLLSQALAFATRHQTVKDANLSGGKLTAIRDLLMRQYQQVFPTNQPRPLKEKNETVSNTQIGRENADAAANRIQMACEAFGDGLLPELQSAVYKLETKFKDHTNETMTAREEPFRCVVKFTSTNILESLRHSASSGIVSTPVTPLLSSIQLKGRNYFVITDNGPSKPQN